MELLPWQKKQWQEWLAQQDRLAQAYLLTGSSGIGISEFIKHMVQSILCRSSQLQACQQCEQCSLLAHQVHPDYFELKPYDDKKEISIDQVRQLNQKLFETSHQGGFKVAVIQQAEKLNVSAFNALLKTIEEPPEKTLIILSSYQLTRLPATIKSRCRQIRFTKPDKATAESWLSQQQPQADMALIRKSLKFCWGSPIAAQSWIVDKVFESQAQWQESLNQFSSGQLTLVQLIEKWKKIEPLEQLFDWFYLLSVQQVRMAVYQNKIELNLNWLSFQQTLAQAKLAWQQNANKDLVLEGLCLQWLKLNQGESLVKGAVFQSNSLRGAL